MDINDRFSLGHIWFLGNNLDSLCSSRLVFSHNHLAHDDYHNCNEHNIYSISLSFFSICLLSNIVIPGSLESQVLLTFHHLARFVGVFFTNFVCLTHLQWIAVIRKTFWMLFGRFIFVIHGKNEIQFTYLDVCWEDRTSLVSMLCTIERRCKQAQYTDIIWNAFLPWKTKAQSTKISIEVDIIPSRNSKMKQSHKFIQNIRIMYVSISFMTSA